MAFGSWLKGLISNVGSVAKKVLPAAKKIISTAAPLVGKLGGMIGGKVGGGLQKLSGAASSLFDANETSTLFEGGTRGASNLLGSGGSGIQKLIPRFK